MRHRKRGRVLGRSPSHRRAMLRNMATSLFLTESDMEDQENIPKVKGRIITTLQKAKEVRPLVEKCITIARRCLDAKAEADKFYPDAKRHSKQWNEWRQSDQWNQWNQAIAPVLTARRRVVQLLGGKKKLDVDAGKIAYQAVQVLFDEIAPRYENRPGGYTRILRLAKPRLGDGGTRAILEFVGKHDRAVNKPEAPEQEVAEDPKEETLDKSAEEKAETKDVASGTSEENIKEEDQSDE